MSNSTNITDPCAVGSASITTPRIQNIGPYVAIGPISNFTAAITSCCSAYTNDSYVSNYNGGSAGESCYYYCSFNGTMEDMHRVMACQKGAADQKKRDQGGDGSGWIGLGSHPDQNDKSSAGLSVFEDPKLGIWRSVVLALAFFGAMAGTL